MIKKFNRGFTLIELLVVIAIIGILSSVVLASLNTARGKGADAAIKSNLANIRAQAEIQYDTLGCYANTGTVCTPAVPAAVNAGVCPASGAVSIFGQANISSQITAAAAASGLTMACSSTAGGTAWAVAAILKTAVADAPNSGWCVDSTGKSKGITVNGGLLQAQITAEVAGGACVE
ncbi:MAG: type II secretion system protein [Minisyncoccia bacterium]